MHVHFAFRFAFREMKKSVFTCRSVNVAKCVFTCRSVNIEKCVQLWVFMKQKKHDIFRVHEHDFLQFKNTFVNMIFCMFLNRVFTRSVNMKKICSSTRVSLDNGFTLDFGAHFLGIPIVVEVREKGEKKSSN